LTLVPLEAATVSIIEGTKIIAFRAVGSKIISTESCIGMYCHEHENVWMWLWNVSGCWWHIKVWGYVWGMYGVSIGTYVCFFSEQCSPTNFTIRYRMIGYLANPTACT
jgi:hypothetical protein